MIIEIHYAQEYKVIDLSCDADDEKKKSISMSKIPLCFTFKVNIQLLSTWIQFMVIPVKDMTVKAS